MLNRSSPGGKTSASEIAGGNFEPQNALASCASCHLTAVVVVKCPRSRHNVLPGNFLSNPVRHVQHPLPGGKQARRILRNGPSTPQQDLTGARCLSPEATLSATLLGTPRVPVCPSGLRDHGLVSVIIQLIRERATPS
jgi:hypothetical protein